VIRGSREFELSGPHGLHTAKGLFQGDGSHGFKPTLALKGFREVPNSVTKLL
jgi:hypothetical protein